MIVKNKEIFIKISIIVILLSFSMSINVLAIKPDITKAPYYNNNTGNAEYIALSIKASTNIRFTTMGWYPYVEIDGRHYGAIAKCDPEDLSPGAYNFRTGKVLEPGQAATYFEMPLTETKDSMIEVIKHAYSVENGDRYNRQVFDDIENVFFQGKTIYLNAVTNYYS